MAVFLQLVSSGNEERRMNIRNKEAIKYQSEAFVGNGTNLCYIIPRNGDVIDVKGIIFDSDLEIQELWNAIESLKLTIGEQEILILEKEMLEMIATPEKVDTKWLFSMDFSPFISNIPLAALAYHEIKLNIHLHDRRNIRGIECISASKYLDNESRRQLTSQTLSLPIQQLQGGALEFDECRYVHMNIDFNGICKGYFLYGDINNIECVTLRLNHQDRFVYNRVMLRLIAKKISDKILYIPYNPSKDWKDVSFESYRDGLNHSRVDSVRMKVEFSTVQSHIGLYGLTSNILNIVGGMGGTLGIYGHVSFLRDFPRPPVPAPAQAPAPAPAIIWTTAIKRIADGKDFCSIAHETIGEGSEYCECIKCKNCFFANEIKTMFQTMAKQCPLCREAWTNWIVYKNT